MPGLVLMIMSARAHEGFAFVRTHFIDFIRKIKCMPPYHICYFNFPS